MKKFLLLLALAGFVTVANLNAQSCGSHSKSVSTTSVSADDEAAAKAASLDANIERKVCQHSGKVSYFKKETCQKSGEVSTVEVQYNAAEGKFVNVSPSGKAKSCCNKGAGEGKACCTAKGGSASKVSLEEKASCSKTTGAKGACCAKKTSAVSATNTAEPVKVKATENQ